jgi:hypothetical protein
MKRMTVKKQRKVLRGWIKWVPVVAIPFAILFFHTWLNIQIIRADYVLRELDAEAREWADRLNHTGMAETIHQDPAMLAAQAEQLAFVQPSPGQREIIYYDPSIPLVAPEVDIPTNNPEDENIAVAQTEGSTQPNPVATESMTDQSAYVERPALTPALESVAVPVAQPIPSAVEPAPVAVEVAPEVPVTPEVPAASVLTEAPAMMVTPVVLELPEEAYVEEVTVLESEMESLESL